MEYKPIKNYNNITTGFGLSGKALVVLKKEAENKTKR